MAKVGGGQPRIACCARPRNDTSLPASPCAAPLLRNTRAHTPLKTRAKTHSKNKNKTQLEGVSFTYPGASAPALTGVSAMVRLSSRVAVLGRNGAGKSTLVKLMTGEMRPSPGGKIWRHPNLRLAYVAQHAFHHVDEHLDTTPVRYVLHR